MRTLQGAVHLPAPVASLEDAQRLIGEFIARVQRRVAHRTPRPSDAGAGARPTPWAGGGDCADGGSRRQRGPVEAHKRRLDEGAASGHSPKSRFPGATGRTRARRRSSLSAAQCPGNRVRYKATLAERKFEELPRQRREKPCDTASSRTRRRIERATAWPERTYGPRKGIAELENVFALGSSPSETGSASRGRKDPTSAQNTQS